ncbi:pantetheine-phosphate adenylyltransferase [Psittacicella gerlachiana]|uniref:Phosphopantetheine adenylyltransferase n=1 Tax=Psittacicella gerlachiana TaxID=2028574 RepID=A0A3A1YJR6_9GAMM|nr:pantetheine-phosphate adenylyltransferase [Psittacicella gerlachiana]RIY38513.1 pantetheine-phosphate adenylyltransferase [Psittacicella gerlachiana]
MKKQDVIALLPASFDPITLGHMDLIKRASKTCNKLIILVMNNFGKKYTFSTQQRLELVEIAVKKLKIENCDIEVRASNSFLAKEFYDTQANFIVRGIRNSQDFDYEHSAEVINSKIYKKDYQEDNFETLYLIASEEYTYISSTSVRQLLTDRDNFLNYATLWLDASVAQKIVEFCNL